MSSWCNRICWYELVIRTLVRISSAIQCSAYFRHFRDVSPWPRFECHHPCFDVQEMMWAFRQWRQRQWRTRTEWHNTCVTARLSGRSQPPDAAGSLGFDTFDTIFQDLLCVAAPILIVRTCLLLDLSWDEATVDVTYVELVRMIRLSTNSCLRMTSAKRLTHFQLH